MIEGKGHQEEIVSGEINLEPFLSQYKVVAERRGGHLEDTPAELQVFVNKMCRCITNFDQRDDIVMRGLVESRRLVFKELCGEIAQSMGARIARPRLTGPARRIPSREVNFCCLCGLPAILP